MQDSYKSLNEEIEKEFRLYDKNGNGTIDKAEFQGTIKQQHNRYNNVDFHTLSLLLNSCDDDYNDVLDRNEFRDMYLKLLDIMILNTFLKYNVDGKLPISNLAIAMTEVNKPIEQSMIQIFITLGETQWTIADFKSLRIFGEPGRIKENECSVEQMRIDTKILEF